MINIASICTENEDGSMTLRLDPDTIGFVVLMDYDGDVISRATKDDGISKGDVLQGLNAVAHGLLHGTSTVVEP